MNLRERFFAELPKIFHLTPEYPDDLEKYLRERGWITEYEHLESLEKPGEGNMNFVLRVITSRKSFIIKQSRPWVEKYPQVKAPMERTNVEADFYTISQQSQSLQKYLPNLIGNDKENYVLALQDLGEGKDYTFLYKNETTLSEAEVSDLIFYLNELHKINNVAFQDNQSMKELNHEHIFKYPFMADNGLDLDNITPGLQELSQHYKKDQDFKQKISALGDIYLANGNTLIHGDYYPGSWLKTAEGIKVIDPEFAYLGQAEFDLGVFVAHLKMAKQPETIMQQILADYYRPQNFDISMFVGFVGVEIMRRILGLAQLPLTLDLEEKKYLLDEAYRFVMQPDQSYMLQLIVK